jgi:pSer/pThr/pTyr-binding forkhead associated (FHA) protein
MARFSLQPLSDDGKPLPKSEKAIDRPTFVGAEGDNDLVLPMGKEVGYPSRRHALLSPEEKFVWLEDLGSKNGTFVNGNKVEKGKRVQLKPDDIVSFTEHQKWRFKDAGDVVGWVNPDRREEGGSDTGLIEEEPRADDPEVPLVSVQVDAPTLEVVSGSRAGERITLQDGTAGAGEWTIGSAHKANFLVLPDDGVSQEHAIITHRQGRWAVDDALSKNGTFVNRQRTLRSYLQSGDEICFGPVRCILRLPDSGRTRT